MGAPNLGEIASSCRSRVAPRPYVSSRKFSKASIHRATEVEPIRGVRGSAGEYGSSGETGRWRRIGEEARLSEDSGVPFVEI